MSKQATSRQTTSPDKRSAWLRKLDEECPYQVVLPRRQLFDDSEIMDFLIHHVGNFDMYVEDDYAAFVRYCFEDPIGGGDFPRPLQAEGRAVSARGLRRLLIINHAGSAPKGGHRRVGTARLVLPSTSKLPNSEEVTLIRSPVAT